LQALRDQLEALHSAVRDHDIEQAVDEIKAQESALSEIKNAHTVKSWLSKARRALKRTQDRDQAAGHLVKAREVLQREITWRNRAAQEYLPGLLAFDDVIKDNIGLRLQPRFSIDQAEDIAGCLSHHKDISLAF
jgi:hypothetical protein